MGCRLPFDTHFLPFSHHFSRDCGGEAFVVHPLNITLPEGGLVSPLESASYVDVLEPIPKSEMVVEYVEPRPRPHSLCGVRQRVMHGPNSLWALAVSQPDTTCMVTRVLLVVELLVGGFVQFGNDGFGLHLGRQLNLGWPVKHPLLEVCVPLAGNIVTEEDEDGKGETKGRPDNVVHIGIPR